MCVCIIKVTRWMLYNLTSFTIDNNCSWTLENISVHLFRYLFFRSSKSTFSVQFRFVWQRLRIRKVKIVNFQFYWCKVRITNLLFRSRNGKRKIYLFTRVWHCVHFSIFIHCIHSGISAVFRCDDDHNNATR